RDLFVSLTEVYRVYFPDAILVADVLWREAEFLRISGRAIDAVPVYEEIEYQDFIGTHKAEARERVIQIWTDASRTTPLPNNIEARMEIPTPHAEWIAIAQRTIADDP